MATGRIGVTPTLRTRWSKAPAGGTTSLSGLDDNSVSLVYDVGYEAVYRNGVLLSRTNDYTATTGNSITLIDATIAGDIIEVFANQLLPLTNAIGNGQYTAKGALLSATAASTPAVLAVGSNDQVLTADSSTATGLKWATPSAGGMTLISEQTPSAVSSLSFSSISGTYKQLMLVWSGVRHNTTGSSFVIRLNNDSNAIYRAYFVGMNDGTYSTRDGDTTHIGDTLFPAFGLSNSQATIRRDSMGTIVIDNYASSTRPKYIRGGWTGNDDALGQGKWTNYSAIYDSTTAITSVDIVRISGSATFSTINNSSIRLYGLS